jgi:hypothetical protein
VTRRRIGWSAIIAGSFVLVFVFVSMARNQVSSSAQIGGMNIGVQSHLAGIRIALRQISNDIKEHPGAVHYEVRWSPDWLAWWHLDDEYDRCYVMYYPRQHRLSYGSAGGEGGWDGVTPDMIAKSLTPNNPYMSFGTFGCQSYP